VRRPRHLLDPDNLRASHLASQSSTHELTRVQQWVMSALVVTTVLHLAAGLSLAAIFTVDGRLDAEIGLNVIAGVIGMLGVAAGFAIHRRSPLTWWVLLGLLPAAVGAWFSLG
jgi:uncharacterized membrane protein